jgi:hypothetical protein
MACLCHAAYLASIEGVRKPGRHQELRNGPVAWRSDLWMQARHDLQHGFAPDPERVLQLYRVQRDPVGQCLGQGWLAR